MAGRSAWLPLSIGLLAGAALAYQVLLFRLLAIVQWHPFAAMIISLALLGHGAAGTVLAIAGRRLLPRFAAVYAAGAALFALSVPLCWGLAQRLPFNGLELVWAPGELRWLAGMFLLLALPFFFAAICFGLAFMHAGRRIPLLYAADLLGAGAGAALAIALLFALPPADALRATAVLGAAAALLAPAPPALRLLPSALAVILATVLPGSWLAPRVVEFKGLPRTLAVMGAQLESEHSSPYGLLDVVSNRTIPFRHAPGRSLTAMTEPPAQLAVFTDGDAMTVMTAFDGEPATLSHLAEMTSALPYHLLKRPDVLVLGAGGGTEVLQALHHGARRIDAVELNPQMVRLVRERYADFNGHLFRHPAVRVHTADARGHARTDPRRYDLIQLAPLDSYGGSGAGVQAVAEDYLYTVEALRDYYALLRPGGFLVLTRWEQQPPREGLKLFATAVAALRAAGADPAARLAFIRSWQTDTLLVRNGPLSAADIARIRAVCEQLGFDPVWFPGIEPHEINRHHRVARPWLYEGAIALLGPDAGRFLADYDFHVAPASDDRPFFFHFFRWGLLPELLELRGQGGLTQLDTGYLVLVGTLALALPLSLVLILAPLATLRRRESYAARLPAGAYFLCLGLAFLFVEIACIQRYTLFIGHPLVAAAAVLSGFLLFAGAGSLLASRLCDRPAALSWVVAGIAALLVLQIVALPPEPGLLGTIGARVALTFALIAPLALLMGMPFPLGLSRVAATAPDFVPWAWGINGCASVLSALLAALLAVHLGFNAVLLIAAVLYLLAAAAWHAMLSAAPRY